MIFDAHSVKTLVFFLQHMQGILFNKERTHCV